MSFRFANQIPVTEAEMMAKLQNWASRNWLANIEYSATDDSHTIFWESWGLSMIDAHFPEVVLSELQACKDAHPNRFIRINAFGQETNSHPKKESLLAQKPL